MGEHGRRGHRTRNALLTLLIRDLLFARLCTAGVRIRSLLGLTLMTEALAAAALATEIPKQAFLEDRVISQLGLGVAWSSAFEDRDLPVWQAALLPLSMQVLFTRLWSASPRESVRYVLREGLWVAVSIAGVWQLRRYLQDAITKQEHAAEVRASRVQAEARLDGAEDAYIEFHQRFLPNLTPFMYKVALDGESSPDEARSRFEELVSLEARRFRQMEQSDDLGLVTDDLIAAYCSTLRHPDAGDVRYNKQGSEPALVARGHEVMLFELVEALCAELAGDLVIESRSTGDSIELSFTSEGLPFIPLPAGVQLKEANGGWQVRVAVPRVS